MGADAAAAAAGEGLMQQQAKKESSTVNNMTAAGTTAFAPKHKAANRGAVWVAKSELSKVIDAAKADAAANKTDSEKSEDQKATDNTKADDKANSITADENPATTSASSLDTVAEPQTLSRQASLSKLNAQAPVFVPKATSSPVPSPTVALQPGQPGVLSMPIPIQPAQADTVPSEVEDQNLSVSGSQQKSFVLSDDIRAQIIQQVEFYFSDANLPTDNYLMKFIKKDPEGYVPIPVIGSFRKVKQLTKNYAAIAAALRTSSKLVVSEDGKRIKRAEPLMDVDLDEIQARTVVAENLPEDHSIQSLEKLFGTVGTVKMVRVCEPGSANSVNNTAMKHPKADRLVSNKLHALVEFETIEQAEKAVAELTDQRNWRSGLHVRLLLRRMYPASKHNHTTKGRKPSSDSQEVAEDDSTEKATENEAPSETKEEGADADAAAGKRGAIAKGRGRGRGRGRGLHPGSLNGGMLGSSPQISCSPSVGEFVIGKPPPGPRMPDGTRGFTFGRGKETAAASAAVVSS